MDLVANILKSFAMIIGSLVAAATAGVTGYYEVKKIVKKEHKIAKTAAGGSGTAAGEGASATVTTPAPPRYEGYYFDTNSGFFLLSIVFLGYMLVKKMKAKVQTNA